jgi:group II intron reverse transcriptase/maturase
VLTGLARIGQIVGEHPDRRLQTIMHYVNKENLKEVHERQKADKATGVDRTDKQVYEENLEENLEDLLGRMRMFKYRPQPVRRVYIPKEGSDKVRPLGIPAYEDKLVQGVMAEILNVIYEPRFYDFSFGFRTGKDQHQAIAYLDDKLMGATSWVVDADIKGFFDNVDHNWMIRFLEHEIEDKNFIRYVKRFMKAGIMEDGKYIDTERGVPQGGLISPVLANVYLHYVIDNWFEKVVKVKLSGKVSMVRYADDNVFCFQYENDARQFYKALKQRLAKFGLEIAEDKTKIIKFGRFAGEEAEKFDFLGFTFITGKTRAGKFTVIKVTSQKKLKVKRQKVKRWLKENMHTPVDVMISGLNRKLKGHYNYYGLSHNSHRMNEFYYYVTQLSQEHNISFSLI